MTLETNSNHEQFARWLLLQKTVYETVKIRLGKDLVHLTAEIDEEEGKVFLKECEHCELPKITHSELDCTSCAIIECNQTTQEGERVNAILRTLTTTPEGKENLNVAIMEEIETMPEFEQTKTLLEELKTRTCICKKICLNERGLKVHKRKCEVAKTALTRELSSASSTNENNMMVQLMSQMREDRKAQQDQIKAQQDQTKLLADSQQNMANQMADNQKQMANIMEKVLKEKETPSENVRNEDKKNEKPTEFPKWGKEEDFSDFKALAKLWDKITKTTAGRKLSQFIESIKEHHPAEYRRVALETTKNDEFMKKIEENAITFDKNVADDIINICFKKIEEHHGLTKHEKIFKDYRTYKKLVQKDNETGLQRCRCICKLHSSLDFLPVVCTQE